MKRGLGHGRRDSSQRKQKEAGRQGAGMENRQRKRQGQASRGDRQRQSSIQTGGGQRDIKVESRQRQTRRLEQDGGDGGSGKQTAPREIDLVLKVVSESFVRDCNKII